MSTALTLRGAPQGHLLRGAPQGHLLRGAGGGGGKGGGGSSHTPTEAPDSLRSRQYARVLDMVSEGEIEGLVGGLRGVYLDDTPVENQDGTRNFSGIAIDWRNGTQAQSYLPGFPAVENEVAVSTQVTAAAPVVRQISNPNINAARVTVSIPQLTWQNPSNGDLGGTSVEIAIDVQSDGGGWVPAKIRTVNAPLAVGGLIAHSAGVPLLSASVGIAWTGVASLTTQYCHWVLEWRAYGSSDPWVQFASGVLSGSGRYDPDPAYGTNGDGFYYKQVPHWEGGLVSQWVSYEEYLAATTRIAAPSASAVGNFTAPSEAAYEFRAVMTSGSGSIGISGATAYRWSGNDIINGKTTSKYQRAYRIPLTGSGPWDIRVRRVSGDSTQQNLQNKTWFESYTEIIDAKLRYPNSAIVGLQVDSSQFRTIPRRGYHIRGLRVRVPSNYDPITRTYTGVWDGTFQVAWSNNPAWCFYDLLTSERYGLGAFIDADQVDKWELYQIGRYCDEMVPDGFGGEEPRFTCNLYLQTRQEAYSVLSSMASIFRGMAWWSSGAVTASADMPGDPVMLFTAANVVDGAFSYSGSSLKARHTVALVSWNDPADRYRQKIEYVPDDAGIALYGVIETEVLAAGCTSRGQAHRFGRWILYSERLETETVTFRCGMDGTYLAPGCVIQTQDAARAGKRFGGRVVSATPSEVTIDAGVTIEPGKTYTLSVILPDGSLESRTVTNGTGSATALAVSPAFSAAPVANAIWVLAASDLLPESWRVLGVAEVEPGTLEVTALAHRPDKYDAVEQNLMLEPLPTSAYSTSPAAVTNLAAAESLYLVTPTIVGNRVTLSWSGEQPFYTVSWQRDGDNLQTRDVTVPTCSIDGIAPGIYTFSVVAVNAIGRRSPPATVVAEVYGLHAPPANVAGFALAPLGGLALLTFAASADLDVIVGGRLLLRHSPNANASWDEAIAIGVDVPGTATSAVAPLLAGRYLAKWEDGSGNVSEAATSIVTTAANVIALNYVAAVAGHPGWAGGKTGTQYLPEFGALGLSSADDWDSDELIDAEDDVDFGGGVATAGAYALGAIDLGSVQVARVSAALEVSPADMNATWDSDELMDSASMVDGDVVAGLDARLWVRTTDDDPAGTPTWSAWAPLALADVSARAYEFELRLASPGGSYNVLVSAATATVDMPDRTESFDDVVSGAGTYSVAFSRPFMVPPALGITAQDMATGDYYEIANKTESGFDITFRNAAGAAVSRSFDAIVRAY